jgi:hypothetical protein
MTVKSSINYGGILRKHRRIPVKGEVTVQVNETVNSSKIIAFGTMLNPKIHEVKVFRDLNIFPDEVAKFLQKKAGDIVRKGEEIAIRKYFFNRIIKKSISPVDGKVESFHEIMETVFVREPPIKVITKAHIPGKVIEIIPQEGAVIEAKADVINGVFGVGGEKTGILIKIVDDPKQLITEEIITDEYKGKILLGGSSITLNALKMAEKKKVSGIIVGGVDEKDLTEFLGYELGLGFTGQEEIGLTLILTDGFAADSMNCEVFRMMVSNENKHIYIDGTTQIRSVIKRPEIIIPITDTPTLNV